MWSQEPPPPSITRRHLSSKFGNRRRKGRRQHSSSMLGKDSGVWESLSLHQNFASGQISCREGCNVLRERITPIGRDCPDTGIKDVTATCSKDVVAAVVEASERPARVVMPFAMASDLQGESKNSVQMSRSKNTSTIESQNKAPGLALKPFSSQTIRRAEPS